MDEFDDVVTAVQWPAPPAVDRAAPRGPRLVMARLVSRVYRAANDTLRADMLRHLLRPLGVLGLAAVSSGAFARLARSREALSQMMSPEDMARYSGEQIRELALFVHEVDPQALQALADLLTQNVVGMAALSSAALMIVYRRSRRRSASSPACAEADVPAHTSDAGGSADTCTE
jgi:hypothetical protein